MKQLVQTTIDPAKTEDYAYLEISIETSESITEYQAYKSAQTILGNIGCCYYDIQVKQSLDFQEIRFQLYFNDPVRILDHFCISSYAIEEFIETILDRSQILTIKVCANDEEWYEELPEFEGMYE